MEASTKDTVGLTVRRLFTSPDIDPFDTVEWELRDARIGSSERVVFEQRDVEFPASWSQNATNIVARSTSAASSARPSASARCAR